MTFATAKMRFLSVLSTLALVGLSRAVGPGVVTGNTAVHDPTMCKDSAGKYFVFCESTPIQFKEYKTKENLATSPGIEIRTSTDRTAWTLVGKVWPNGASWTDAYTGTSNGSVTS